MRELYEHLTLEQLKLLLDKLLSGDSVPESEMIELNRVILEKELIVLGFEVE